MTVRQTEVLVVSMGGAGSSDINEVAAGICRRRGYCLMQWTNWVKDSGGSWAYHRAVRGAARRVDSHGSLTLEELRSNERLNPSEIEGEKIITSYDAMRVMNSINIVLANSFFCNLSKDTRSLLLVGKSAGGMLAWNTYRLHYRDIKERFCRFALVLVDPHGAVTGDGRSGTYCSTQDLLWPPEWTDGRNVFRVYNIFEQESPSVIGDFNRALSEGRDAVGGLIPLGELARETIDAALPTLTGASFPSGHVCENVRIRGGEIDHFNITQDPGTSQLIDRAYSFVRHGIGSCGQGITDSGERGRVYERVWHGYHTL